MDNLLRFADDLLTNHQQKDHAGISALTLALATCVGWNLGLWALGRYRGRRA